METKSKNKQVKKLEKYLRNYKAYKVGLLSLQKQLDYIMPNVTATYELMEGSSGTFRIASTTENYAIDRIESKKALILHEDINHYTMILDTIDEALNELEEIERKFIHIRYIQRKTVTQTALDLGYSEKYIFNLRNQVFDKLLISMRVLLTF